METKHKMQKHIPNRPTFDNIYNERALCMDILKTNWSPAWTIQSLCRAILFLLNEPNAESPLNCDAGNLIRSGDIKGFKSMAKMYTKEYAS
ncbi:ubiquitin-conjugating enzyme E2, putative [Plasmodium chabaudi chabaudi]|uniref:Ubiquitin-conjugating enzyme E2, putative n=1 Tax=Plasmodium chabaudi chabaudi TaxID=31271 RepID=A0A1D3RQZ0_PLACU|nr:ubiquitin-conjugating enzyme E2, putative [Plasmodium chabaudi chabaudi]